MFVVKWNVLMAVNKSHKKRNTDDQISSGHVTAAYKGHL